MIGIMDFFKLLGELLVLYTAWHYWHNYFSNEEIEKRDKRY